MAAGDTQITVVGNLTHDPDLKFTNQGKAVCNFQVASTPRFMDRKTNEWKDGDPLFLRCTAWDKFGENCAETLQRGMRVIVQGRLKQNNWEDKDGNKRTGYQVEVDEVGPSLKFATAKVNRAERQGGGGIANDPWASAAPAPPRQPAGVGAQGAAQGWGGNNNLTDEPPF